MWFEMQVLHSNRASKQGTTRPAANVCHHSQAKLHSPYLGAALACSLECTSIVILCLPRGTRCRSSTNIKKKKKKDAAEFWDFPLCRCLEKCTPLQMDLYGASSQARLERNKKKKVDGLMKDFVAELLRKQEGGGGIKNKRRHQ